MKRRQDPAWRKEGSEPDYRFSLANERTFLAWIRTALALLAGAVAIDQLAPSLAHGTVRVAISLILAGVGAGLAALAYRRWKAQERAMRTNQPLPHSHILWLMSALVAVAAVVFAVLVLI